jgi:hypothetical protein
VNYTYHIADFFNVNIVEHDAAALIEYPQPAPTGAQWQLGKWRSGWRQRSLIGICKINYCQIKCKETPPNSMQIVIPL